MFRVNDGRHHPSFDDLSIKHQMEGVKATLSLLHRDWHPAYMLDHSHTFINLEFKDKPAPVQLERRMLPVMKIYLLIDALSVPVLQSRNVLWPEAPIKKRLP